jgi:hypothetical protein
MIAAGGSITARAELNVDEFLEQAREYEGQGGIDAMLKVVNFLDMSHPFHTIRAAEIARWEGSRDYHQILQGVYRTRGDKPSSRRLAADLRDGAEYYARGARDAVAGVAEEARQKVQEVRDAARQAADRVGTQRVKSKD